MGQFALVPELGHQLDVCLAGDDAVTVGVGLPKFSSVQFSKVFRRTPNLNWTCGEAAGRTVNQNQENQVQQVQFGFNAGSDL